MSTFLGSFSEIASKNGVTFLLVIIVILLLLKILLLEKKLQKMLLGKDAKTLEDSIVHIADSVKAIQTREVKTQDYLVDAEKRIERSIQAVETIRFNPFKGSGEGGSQSFATALLNEHGNGVVLSGLYSRDRISIFSKPIEKLKSEYTLTGEEEDVVARANTKLQK